MSSADPILPSRRDGDSPCVAARKARFGPERFRLQGQPSMPVAQLRSRVVDSVDRGYMGHRKEDRSQSSGGQQEDDSLSDEQDNTQIQRRSARASSSSVVTLGRSLVCAVFSLFFRLSRHFVFPVGYQFWQAIIAMFATALISKWACHLEASGKGSFPVMPAWLTTSFCPAESSHLPIVSAISEEVKTQIRHHLRSGAGYRDFASYDLGGRPIKAWTSPTYTLSRRFGYKAVASRIGLAPPAARPPSIALQPDMRPGFCWPFSGASGHLAIRLSQPIRIHNVSVEHIRAELVRDVTTAPRTFVLWAVVKPHDVQALEGRRTMEVAPSKLLTHALPRSASLLPLAQFDYNINSDEQVQTFPLDDTTLRLNLTSQAVVFQVLTNWGSKENTCLYRVCVHGEP